MQVVAVTGKGGVGKTNVAVNSLALSKLEKDVVLFDAAWACNVDLLMGFLFRIRLLTSCLAKSQ